MEIILMVVAGIIVFIIAIISIIKGLTHRVQATTQDLKRKSKAFKKELMSLKEKRKTTLKH